MAEIAFEYFAAALESTRGTAIAAPTHILNLEADLTPADERYRPVESRGTLAEFHRSKTMKRWADWQGKGPADTRLAPFLLSMGLVTTPTPTVVTASQVWRWAFTRAMTADNLKSATLFFGDPNTQIFQSPFGMVEEFSITADAGGNDGAMMDFKGFANFPSKIANPSLPAQVVGPLLAPGEMQLYLDTSSAIGTTIVAGKFISFELKVPTGATKKYYASGPSGGLNYSRIGRKKTHPELKIVFEFADTTEYDLYASNNGDTVVKIRIRLNGPVIETTNRHYIEIDMWAPLGAAKWGAYEDSNRTLELTAQGEYDSTAATDLKITVQNNSGTV
jgi:hypothetical protein